MPVARRFGLLVLTLAGCTSREAPGTAPLVTADAAIADGGDAGTDQPYGGAWQALTNAPPFYPGEAALLTDGTVLVNAASTPDWWRLTPDSNGSYVNGTWSAVAPMTFGYAPTWFAVVVLPSGSVVALGGEYNRGADAWTSLGALYDPVVNAWTPIMPPPSLAGSTYGVGDAPTVVLPNGVLMVGPVASKSQVLFDPRTLTFATTGANKYDENAEEGWTLLPSGKVLTLDVYGAPRSEIFDPATGGWSLAASTPVGIADKNVGEVGPAVLMPNGTVLALGATGHNALFHTSNGTWSVGPDFPVDVDGGQLDVVDGAAALLTNGHVLCVASPGVYSPPSTFWEFDGTNLTPLPGTPGAPKVPSFSIMLLPLPSGEVLAVDGTQDVEVFAPAGSPDPSWAPTITQAPATVARRSTNALQGTQLNGLSQACSYGDDDQCATNYPLVRITNSATGHVFYARTHDHSTMAVATGTLPESTLFDVGAAVETGPSTLVVVANGIASLPRPVTVQ